MQLCPWKHIGVYCSHLKSCNTKVQFCVLAKFRILISVVDNIDSKYQLLDVFLLYISLITFDWDQPCLSFSGKWATFEEDLCAFFAKFAFQSFIEKLCVKYDHHSDVSLNVKSESFSHFCCLYPLKCLATKCQEHEVFFSSHHLVLKNKYRINTENLFIYR